MHNHPLSTTQLVTFVHYAVKGCFLHSWQLRRPTFSYYLPFFLSFSDTSLYCFLSSLVHVHLLNHWPKSRCICEQVTRLTGTHFFPAPTPPPITLPPKIKGKHSHCYLYEIVFREITLVQLAALAFHCLTQDINLHYKHALSPCHITCLSLQTPNLVKVDLELVENSRCYSQVTAMTSS